MDKYTIGLFSGDKITLNEKQYKQALELWDAGAEEFSFGGRRFSRKAVAYIGTHQSTAQINQLEQSNTRRILGGADIKKIKAEELRKARIAYNKKKRQETEDGLKQLYGEVEAREELPIGNAEDEKGDPMYWVDEYGQKHYS